MIKIKVIIFYFLWRTAGICTCRTLIFNTRTCALPEGLRLGLAELLREFLFKKNSTANRKKGFLTSLSLSNLLIV
jgi:hypothetical protein